MVDFERICLSYENCNKKKANKQSSMEFSFALVCRELQKIVDDINARSYAHGDSTCFVVNYPCAREVFAATYRDRIVQTFFCEEIQPALNEVLLPTTTSCRKGMGTDYALKLLLGYIQNASANGTQDAYYLKLDLSGYFMHIQRQRLTHLMLELIRMHYHGMYADDLLYLAPIIYMDNPATHCIPHCDLTKWERVPARKILNPNGDSGIAIGNITSQHGSNLYLNDIDHYCAESLNLPDYVRYVDDIVIVNEDKAALVRALPFITKRLSDIGMVTNPRKTVIDTVYHGVKFLGKVTYPYGYQKCTKEAAGRTMKHSRTMRIDDSLLPRLNSHIGRLKNYASYHLIHDYIAELPTEVWQYVRYDENGRKFVLIKEVTQNENPNAERWFFSQS